ncbi:predicted protein [Arabidopsis lyrata subsp. lyrata]|uniref:Predicted protein n=1 Tax=Arabidopsis lyrata subsp. lyrata TaxID=81972 RepID=D7MS21_ARALL|nr:predicted protein [Arabidopsis lyrata subsp. lyrata]
MEETCVLKKVATEEVVTNKVVELEEGELVTEEVQSTSGAIQPTLIEVNQMCKQQSTVSPSILITKADCLNETQEDSCS